MAVGKSGCFHQRIKFLSDEQQFLLDVPRRLFTYAVCDVGWWYRLFPTTTGTSLHGFRTGVDSLARFTGPAGMHSAIIRTSIERPSRGERDWRTHKPGRYRSAASICWQSGLEPLPSAVRADNDEASVRSLLGMSAGNEPCCNRFQPPASQALYSR